MIEPRHERTAAWALLAWLALGVVGIVTVIGGAGVALILTARWVFCI